LPTVDPVARREYQRVWIRDRREAFFADKVCLLCAGTESLELHHVDPEEKISHRIWSWSEERRAIELAKCAVLCDDCHKAAHRHGSSERYALGCRCATCRDGHWLRGFMERRASGFQTPPQETPAKGGNDGGGGNRTRVTSPAESPSEQEDRPRPCEELA
jgi:hypothetical protein